KLMRDWAKKDPISNYEEFLMEQGELTQELIGEIKDGFSTEIEDHLKLAFEEPPVPLTWTGNWGMCTTNSNTPMWRPRGNPRTSVLWMPSPRALNNPCTATMNWSSWVRILRIMEGSSRSPKVLWTNLARAG